MGISLLKSIVSWVLPCKMVDRNYFFIFIKKENKVFNFFVKVGYVDFFVKNKNVLKSNIYLMLGFNRCFFPVGLNNNNFFFLVRDYKIKNCIILLKFLFIGFVYGWIVELNIFNAYNYFLRGNYMHSFLRINVGFRYKIFLQFPKEIKVYNFKRGKLKLCCKNYKIMKFIIYFLENIRNLLPYKFKGIFLINKLNSVKLKEGKKMKKR